MADCACPVVVSTVAPPIGAVVAESPQPIAAILANSARIVQPSQLQVIAGEDIATFAAVYVASDTAFLASNNDLPNFDKFAGIAHPGALTGQQMIVLTEGFVQNPAWNWVNGFVWLGTSGALTQVPPAPNTSIYRQFVGLAVSPVKIILRISEPILYNI